jgi:hypothetical protein
MYLRPTKATPFVSPGASIFVSSNKSSLWQASEFNINCTILSNHENKTKGHLTTRAGYKISPNSASQREFIYMDSVKVITAI